MNKKILLIGELCNDVFTYGKCDRLCPEAPCPVINPTKTRTNWGMAGNVWSNLKSLSEDTNEIVFLQQGNDITKHRFIDETSGYILLRVDSDDEATNSVKIFDVLKKTSIQNLDAVVISDYNKGYITDDFLTELVQKVKGFEKNIPIFVDTKKKFKADWAENVDFIKINEKEFKNQSPLTCSMLKWGKNLIVTNGPNGVSLYDNKNMAVQIFPCNKVETIYDVSGAGDTFLAALVIKFLETNNVVKSIKYANLAAGIAVSKRGVVAVTKKEVDSILV